MDGPVAREPTTRDASDRSGEPAGRDRFLGLIAVFKLVKSVLLVAVGVGALQLVKPDVIGSPDRWLAMLSSGVDRRLTQAVLVRATSISPGRLEALGVGAFLYAGLFAVEGIGLWRRRRWAEYLTVIATASFVPFEVYELVHELTAPRVSALVLNLAIVAYLIIHLRRR
jgi:uncharacterized membrane protein (DUF2068 family)